MWRMLSIVHPAGNPAEVSGWMLHSNAMCDAEYQHVANKELYGVPPRLSDRVSSTRKDAICRALLQTPGASSWRNCAVGAGMCTWAPIEGSTFVEVLAQAAGVDSSAKVSKPM